MGKQKRLGRQRKRQEMERRETEKRASFRKMLGLGIATCAATAGAALVFYTAKPIERPPLTQPPAAVVTTSIADMDFAKFRELFNQNGPVSYNDAVKFIEQKTGIHITSHSHNLPDPCGVLRAKRFYEFLAGVVQYPKSLAAKIGSDGLLLNSNGSSKPVYDTPLLTRDGRIKALADYILTKNDKKDAVQTALALANWVHGNLQCDTNFTGADNVQNMSSADVKKYFSQRNIGISNSFSNSISILRNMTGVCNDFSNLTVDLLNSVGIPARKLSLYACGISTDNVVRANSVSHAIIQVFLPNEQHMYIDAVPAKWRHQSEYCTTIDSPSDYVRELFRSVEPQETIIYINISGAIVEDRMPKNLRTLIQNYPLTYVRDGNFAVYYNSFLQEDREKYPNPEDRHVIHLERPNMNRKW